MRQVVEWAVSLNPQSVPLNSPTLFPRPEEVGGSEVDGGRGVGGVKRAPPVLLVRTDTCLALGMNNGNLRRSQLSLGRGSDDAGTGAARPWLGEKRRIFKR